jgi:DNA-binding GntR family transcriptional regulator
MAVAIGYRAPPPPEDMAELRLLMELTAVRRLAHRGLSGGELALVTRLADATTRAARSRDVPRYVPADTNFHLCLLELTGDPVLHRIARLLLAPDLLRAPRAEEPHHLMAREAREHRELAGLVADGMVSAADQLVRLHLSRRSAGRLALPSLAEPELISFARG